MDSKAQKAFDSIDELFIKDEEHRPAAGAQTKVTLDGIKARLKARIDGGPPPFEPNLLDRDKDPTELAQQVDLLGDVAGHQRMFRRDRNTGHERTFDEIKQLVTNLCRQRGVDAIVEMVLLARYFRFDRLPEEMQSAVKRVFKLE